MWRRALSLAWDWGYKNHIYSNLSHLCSVHITQSSKTESVSCTGINISIHNHWLAATRYFEYFTNLTWYNVMIIIYLYDCVVPVYPVQSKLHCTRTLAWAECRLVPGLVTCQHWDQPSPDHPRPPLHHPLCSWVLLRWGRLWLDLGTVPRSPLLVWRVDLNHSVCWCWGQEAGEDGDLQLTMNTPE